MAIKQLLKRGTDIFGNIFKTADSKIIKTSTKLTGSMASAVGGSRSIKKKVAAQVAKGAGGSPIIGGRTIKTAASKAGSKFIKASPYAALIGGSIYGIDKIKNVMSRQSEFYRTKDDTQNYINETDALQDRITTLENVQKSPMADDTDVFGMGSPYALGATGSDDEGDDEGNSSGLLIGGLAAAALAGIYLFSKKKKGKK